MNTAMYRQIARDAEKSLEWDKAARFYRLAAENYPDGRGELAKADIAALFEHARTCDAMIKYSRLFK